MEKYYKDLVEQFNVYDIKFSFFCFVIVTFSKLLIFNFLYVFILSLGFVLISSMYHLVHSIQGLN